MFCSNCGEENRNDRKFCANCGNPLKDYTKETPKQDLLMPQDVIEANKKQVKTKNSIKARGIISLFLIVVAIVCVCVSHFAIKNNQIVQIILLSVSVLFALICVVLLVVNSKAIKQIKNQD